MKPQPERLDSATDETRTDNMKMKRIGIVAYALLVLLFNGFGIAEEIQKSRHWFALAGVIVSVGLLAAVFVYHFKREHTSPRTLWWSILIGAAIFYIVTFAKDASAELFNVQDHPLILAIAILLSGLIGLMVLTPAMWFAFLLAKRGPSSCRSIVPYLAGLFTALVVVLGVGFIVFQQRDHLGIIQGHAARTRAAELEVLSGTQRLLDLVQNPDSPIQYDKEVAEFQIVFSEKLKDGNAEHRIPLNYNPFSGQPLSSGRASLFVQPAKSEIERLKGIFDGAKTVSEVFTRAGKPTRVWEGSQSSKTQYDYTNQSATVDVIVLVGKDDKLNVLYFPKQINKTGLGNRTTKNQGKSEQ